MGKQKKKLSHQQALARAASGEDIQDFYYRQAENTSGVKQQLGLGYLNCYYAHTENAVFGKTYRFVPEAVEAYHGIIVTFGIYKAQISFVPYKQTEIVTALVGEKELRKIQNDYGDNTPQWIGLFFAELAKSKFTSVISWDIS